MSGELDGIPPSSQASIFPSTASRLLTATATIGLVIAVVAMCTALAHGGEIALHLVDRR